MSDGELSASSIIDFIEDIFLRRGVESYLGEAVTMSQHMLQAAFLAEEAGASAEVIAAALLHDLGHYTNEFAPAEGLERNNRHESFGAAVLAPYFPPKVLHCIRYHVDAKRYLSATDANYEAALSSASVRTLALQGGPMEAAERDVFAQLPDLDDILAVRRWDDGAKDPRRVTPSLSHYLPVLRQVQLSQ